MAVLYFGGGRLLKLLLSKCIEDEDAVKIETGRCLSNIIKCNDQQIIDLLCSKNCINALKYVMKTSSYKKPLIRCIESFDIILSKTRFPRKQDRFDYISKVEKVGLVEVFDILQAGVDDNDKVYTFSYDLCRKYWESTKPIITYSPPINYKYPETKINIKTNLIFNVEFIRDYLYKKKISFAINKINCIMITCILQTVCSQIFTKIKEGNRHHNPLNHHPFHFIHHQQINQTPTIRPSPYRRSDPLSTPCRRYPLCLRNLIIN